MISVQATVSAQAVSVIFWFQWHSRLGFVISAWPERWVVHAQSQGAAGTQQLSIIHTQGTRGTAESWTSGSIIFSIPDLPWSFSLGPHLLPHRQFLPGLHCRALSSWFWFSSALECPKAKRDHSQVFLLRNWVFLDQFGISLTSTGKRGQALSTPLNHLDIMNRGWEFWCVSDEDKALLSIGLFL